MKNNIIKPNALKGNEEVARIIKLMGNAPINESTSRSSLELVKKGPDGKIYGIVKESHQFYIKITNKTENLVAEDFQYIGGLANKPKSPVYTGYADAIKHLNLKFISLAEAEGKTNDINSFRNDEELMEDSGFVLDKKGHDQHIMELEAAEEDDVELTEDEEAIDSMVEGDEEKCDIQESKRKVGTFSIADAMKNIDEAVGTATNERVTAILETLETLSEKEQLALLQGLKKKI